MAGRIFLRCRHRGARSGRNGAHCLISIAPAVYRFSSGLEGQPRCPWLVVQGDDDEFVNIDETVEWLNSLDPGPELLVLRGAEHFFHGKLSVLRDVVREFVKENIGTVVNVSHES